MTSLLHSVRIWDAIDLLLVAAILYGVFAAFKVPRALQLMAALGALMLGSFIARRLGLASTTWLLESFWSFWLIALIVLFQPELRRALARAGESPLLRGMGREDADKRSHVIDDVLKTAEALAARRMGALIVMERGEGLGAYADLGVPLDALVSADLLLSLFLPYSPLHDGAVLLREDRIVAAGCFLPLSRNAQIGRALGTRHRAALGLAEESDAVVLAVSEETGRISLAVDGRIEAPLEGDTLRARLEALFAIGAAPVRRRTAWWRTAWWAAGPLARVRK